MLLFIACCVALFYVQNFIEQGIEPTRHKGSKFQKEFPLVFLRVFVAKNISRIERKGAKTAARHDDKNYQTYKSATQQTFNSSNAVRYTILVI